MVLHLFRPPWWYSSRLLELKWHQQGSQDFEQRLWLCAHPIDTIEIGLLEIIGLFRLLLSNLSTFIFHWLCIIGDGLRRSRLDLVLGGIQRIGGNNLVLFRIRFDFA